MMASGRELSGPFGVVRTHSAGSRGSPRRAGPPADVSDAVASLLSLPIGPTAADEDKTQVSSSDQDISPSVDSSATEIAAAAPPPSAQARHNATERQRVRKLKSAYLELDEVIRSRPDLVNTRTLPEEGSNRRRSRSSDHDEGSSSRAPAGPSHLAILQESAAAVRSLFSLVDSLVRRNQDLEKSAQTKSADHGL